MVHDSSIAYLVIGRGNWVHLRITSSYMQLGASFPLSKMGKVL